MKKKLTSHSGAETNVSAHHLQSPQRTHLEVLVSQNPVASVDLDGTKLALAPDAVKNIGTEVQMTGSNKAWNQLNIFAYVQLCFLGVSRKSCPKAFVRLTTKRLQNYGNFQLNHSPCESLSWS